MVPNNLSGISIQDDLDESDFSEISTPAEMDLKQIAEKIKKLESKLATTNESKSWSDQFVGSSMMQVGWNFGEKFGKMEKEIEGMKKEMDILRAENAGMKAAKPVNIGAFEELKEKVEKLSQENQKLAVESAKMKKEFDNKNTETEEKIEEKERQMRKIMEEVEKMGQKNVKLNEALTGNRRAIEGIKKVPGKLGKENQKLSEENEKIKKEFGKKNAKMEGKIEEKDRQMLGMKDEIEKLGQENVNLRADLAAKGRAMEEMKKGMAEMKDQKVEKKLLNNLAERIAHSETRIIFDFSDMKENKWNPLDCSQKLVISDGGRVVKHYGYAGINSARAQSPIKFNLNTNNASIVYFEVELVAIHPSNFAIGFCTQQFSLENDWIGSGQNSIGICSKKGIFIDGTKIKFANNSAAAQFQANDVIGIGIVHFPKKSKMKCFASCSGNLLGMAELPPKFAALELFPGVTLYQNGDSVRANFGSDPWKYNPISEQLTN